MNIYIVCIGHVRSNIKGLEYRLKYSKTNKDVAEQKTILMLEKELTQYNTENGRYDVKNWLSKFLLEFEVFSVNLKKKIKPKIKEIEQRIAIRAAKIKKLKEESNQIEDEIFKEFCAEIRVENIRVYEERELAGQQEAVKERMVFEEKKTRLTTQLEFEKSRDTLSKFFYFFIIF